MNDARVELADTFDAVRLLNERDTLRVVTAQIAKVKHNLSVEENKIAARLDDINIQLTVNKIRSEYRQEPI